MRMILTNVRLVRTTDIIRQLVQTPLVASRVLVMLDTAAMVLPVLISTIVQTLTHVRTEVRVWMVLNLIHVHVLREHRVHTVRFCLS